MARPRIFVSSTYYDLRHVRNALSGFIQSLGYDAVLFENGDIIFHHDMALEESCYAEVINCHMLVLIIGGRYGSLSNTEKNSEMASEKSIDESLKSITRKEYETARDKEIPIFIFVDKGVYAEYRTYLKNKNTVGIEYAHVDSVGVFEILQSIISQRRNNFVREFEHIEDITSWLRDQWAGLFADFIARRADQASISNLSAQVDQLGGLVNTLKSYVESVMLAVAPEKAEGIISIEEDKIEKKKKDIFFHSSFGRYLLKRAAENDKVSKDQREAMNSVYEHFQSTDKIEDLFNKLGINTEKFSIAGLERVKNDYEELIKLFK